MEMGCPGRCWSHHPWRCLRWHSVNCAVPGAEGSPWRLRTPPMARLSLQSSQPWGTRLCHQNCRKVWENQGITLCRTGCCSGQDVQRKSFHHTPILPDFSDTYIVKTRRNSLVPCPLVPSCIALSI